MPRPLIDAISVLAYDTAKYNHLAMYVDGEREWKRIKPKHWQREAQACGFNPKTMLRLISDIVEAVPAAAKAVLAECAAEGVKTPVLKKLTAAIAKRCRELKEEY